MHSELASPTRVRDVLAHLGIQPSKTLGQNFLIDANILRILLQAAQIDGQDRVLEIGPGLGILTHELSRRAAHVVALEKDHRLFDYLVGCFGEDPAVTLQRCDALTAAVASFGAGRCNKMVSNLPYNVASRILIELAGMEQGPECMVVTVQEEVARRLAARPRDEEYGMLSVRVQCRYQAEIVKKVSPNCFWPRPRVGSMIVALHRNQRSPLPHDLEQMFERLSKRCFEHRRKQMRGILVGQWTESSFSAAEAETLLTEAAIAPTARPEAIDVEHWLRLAGALIRRNTGPDN